MAEGQLKQANRMAELTSVFGKDELSVVTIECDEGLSEDFEIRLEVLSQKEDLDFDQAIATSMTVKVVTNNGDTRHFDGLLTDAKWMGYRDSYYIYKLTLRPGSGCSPRIQIVEFSRTCPRLKSFSNVLNEHDFADFQDQAD